MRILISSFFINEALVIVRDGDEGAAQHVFFFAAGDPPAILEAGDDLGGLLNPISETNDPPDISFESLSFAAELIGRFEERHLPAALGKLPCGHHSGQPTAYYHRRAHPPSVSKVRRFHPIYVAINY